MLHEYVALVAGGVCISGPHGSETVAAVLGRLPPPGHCTDSRMKHITVFLWKRPIYLSYRFSLRDRCQFTTHLEATKMLSGNGGWGTPSLHSPLTLLQLTGTSWEGAHNLSGVPIFSQLLWRGHLRLTGLEASRVYYCCATGWYIFDTLKTTAWECGLQSTWK